MTQRPPGDPGRVIADHGHIKVVESPDGTAIECRTRRQLPRAVCGDRVRWEPAGAGQGVITAVEPRRNVIERHEPRGRTRPLAANVDRLLVVTAPEPPLDPGLIDRYLVAAGLTGAAAAILVNKTDLLDEPARAGLRERLVEFEALGYPVVPVSALSGAGLDSLLALLAGDTAVLVGQSGVGKSSVVTALVPDSEARVGALSERSGLGRHTTTTTRLYHLPGGGALIDSPGVRDFHLWQVGADELAAGFVEFRDYAGQCRFHNCRHRNEPDCAVAAAAARGAISPRRLASYRTLLARMEQARDARAE